MNEPLLRFTTEYVGAEDRIRLVGESAEKTVVLWLTPRLMNRLVLCLCQWLDQRVGATPLTEVRQEIAQQKALVELESQRPVRADAQTPAVLIHKIVFKPSRASVSLRFKDNGGHVVANLQLKPKPLRQWLQVLHGRYLQAGWSTNVWPVWVAEVKPRATPSRAAVLH